MNETCIYKIINGFANIGCGRYNECHGLTTIRKNIIGVRLIGE